MMLLWCFSAADAVAEVQVLALMGGKAILQVDGTRRVMSAGDTSPEGVTLISASTHEAVVERDGVRETLQLSTVHAPIQDSVDTVTDDVVTLWAGPDGFFHVNGSVNGYPVRFLVDTGASNIALSGALARRIGIDRSKGQRGVAQTASGLAPMTAVKLRSVSIGGIEIVNVDAGVIEGNFPVTPLLGMSFLGQVDMLREGNKLELRKR